MSTWVAAKAAGMPTALREAADNPVLVKGVRTRMRGAKAYWLMVFYMLALGIVMLIVFVAWSASGHRAYSAAAGRELGRGLYYAVFITQACLIYIIAPALSSGALTLELEQRTYEMLICTRLGPRTIVAGKILSGWVFLLMLITVSLPMAGIAMLIGGVSPGEIVIAYVAAALSALLFCAIGVFWSAANTRTAAAGLAALGTTIVLGVVTSIAGGVGPSAFTCTNPITAAVQGTEPAPIFDITPPNWLFGLPLLALGCALMAALATAKVRGYPRRNQTTVRVLLLVVVWGGLSAFYGCLFASAGGGTTPWAVGPTRESMAVAVGISLGLLAPLAVGLATGEGRRLATSNLPGWLLRGLRPGRMFSGALEGAPAYTMLLAAGAFGLLGLSAIVAARPSHVPSNVMHLWRWASVMSVAMLLAYISFAGFMSLLASRLGAGVLVMLLIILAWVTPWPMMALSWQYGSRHLLTNETLYLSPIVLLTAAVNHGTRLPITWAQMARLPLWAAAAGLHLVAAAAWLSLAQVICGARLRRQARAVAEKAKVPHAA